MYLNVLVENKPVSLLHSLLLHFTIKAVMVHLLNSFTISSYTVILKMSLHFPRFFSTNLSIALLLKGRAKNKDRT